MDSACFVVSRSKVLERYNLLRELCSGISFSTKTNPEVARILEEETDCMFSIHTQEGLEWVQDPSRIIYLIESAGPDALQELLKFGIRNFVVDSQPDLDTFLKAIEESKTSVNLFLRMRFQETTVHKGRYFLFGMRPETINRLIPGLKKNPLIRSLGIHFHRNTQNTGNWSYRDLLEEMLTQDTLRDIDAMNIGGGIPVAYRNTNDSNLDYILEKLSELRSWLDSLGIRMVMEPGRPIAAPATRLETRITSVHGNCITVNCSVYNTSLDTIIVPYKLLVEGEDSGTQKHPPGHKGTGTQKGTGRSHIIKGCTPCSMDIFRYECRLSEPSVGGKLVFLNAGAYNFASDFCNLPKLETVVVD